MVLVLNIYTYAHKHIETHTCEQCERTHTLMRAHAHMTRTHMHSHKVTHTINASTHIA